MWSDQRYLVAARLPASQTAVQALLQLIVSGQLAEGARLPPERQLAAELKVSRATLREALSILETLGLVRIEPSRGAFVAAQEANGSLATDPRRLGIRYELRDVYQIRLATEAYAARLAAMRISPDDVAALEAAHASFRTAAAAQDLVSSSLYDFEFHHLVMRLSGNRMLTDLGSNYRAVLLASQRLPMVQPRRRWEPIIEHERILEALTRRDPEGAAYFMRLHITKSATAAGIDVADLP
jgi:GntR family transcriptional regulator, transcriptional repressor for pyruvate dehydrogenase complex